MFQRVRSWKHLNKMYRKKMLKNMYTGENLSVDDALWSVKYVAGGAEEFCDGAMDGEKHTLRELYDILSREHKFHSE